MQSKNLIMSYILVLYFCVNSVKTWYYPHLALSGVRLRIFNVQYSMKIQYAKACTNLIIFTVPIQEPSTLQLAEISNSRGIYVSGSAQMLRRLNLHPAWMKGKQLPAVGLPSAPRLFSPAWAGRWDWWASPWPPPAGSGASDTCRTPGSTTPAGGRSAGSPSCCASLIFTHTRRKKRGRKF